MDPLSITTAVVAFVGAANVIVKKAAKLSKAPEEIHQAVAEIARFKQFVDLVSKAVSRRSKTFEDLQQEYTYVSGILSTVTLRLVQLDELISATFRSELEGHPTSADLKNRLAWARQGKVVLRILKEIERDRNDLLALLPAILLLSLDEMHDWVAVGTANAPQPQITNSSTCPAPPEPPETKANEVSGSLDPVLDSNFLEDARCSCSCHRRVILRSGPVLSAMFGNATMMFTRTWRDRCDEPKCAKESTKELKVHYRFPLRLWSYVFRITCVLRQPMGVVFNLHVCPTRAFDDPLFRVGQRGGTETLYSMFRNGKASPYDAMPNGNTLLDIAFLTHDWQTANMLIDQGAPLEGFNEEGGNPLQWATETFLKFCHLGFPSKLAEEVLRKAIGDGIEGNNFTRLHKAVLGISRLSLSQLLADDTRDINQVDYAGRTPLWWAALLQNECAMQILLDEGADPNLTSITGGGLLLPVTHAPPRDREFAFSTATVRKVLDAGYDINQTSFGGHTPLMVAVHYNDVDLIRLYLSYGADIHAKSRRGQNLVHHTAFHDATGEVMQEIIDRGGDDLNENDLGLIPISYTFVLGNVGSLKVLLKRRPIHELPIRQQDILLSRAFEMPNVVMLDMLGEYCWAKASDCNIFHMADIEATIWTKMADTTSTQHSSGEIQGAIERLLTKVQRCRSESFLQQKPTGQFPCRFCDTAVQEQGRDEFVEEFTDAPEYQSI